MQRTVYVGVFGATTGLTVTAFSPKGAREALREEIPWEGDARDGIYWPEAWLNGQLDRLKDMAGAGDVLALAMPGADLYLRAGDDSSALPIQHYRGVMDGGFIEAATAKIPPTEIYRRTNGANVAAFQPYGQLLGLNARHPGVLDGVREVVPLGDWMTYRLTGERGHDPVMLQDQGLTSEGRQACGEIVGREDLGERIAPWRIFTENEILRTDDGVYVVPVTHDSVPARTAGYSASPWVVWTGTWVGTACRVDQVQASALAYEVGAAFEGAGASLSAITNVGMLGRAYRALVRRSGFDFEEASGRVWRTLRSREVELFDVAALPADEEEAVRQLIDRYGEDEDLLLSACIASTARACHERIRATATALTMEPPMEVAVIGGWARNSAFITALEQYYGPVRIPAQAACATAVGLAADALVRVGDAPSMGEALEMLPELKD